MINRANSAIGALAAGVLVASAALMAQTPKPAQTPTPAPKGPPALEEYSGTTINLNPGAGITLSIQVLRWSADADRDKIVSALTATSSPPATPATPAAPATAATPSTGATPDKGESDLTKILQEMPTAGYIWTGGALGYTLKYARRQTLPDGGEQVVVLTDRPLGSWDRTGPWKASTGSSNAERPFTVIELRLNRNGVGQGKMSLTAPFAVDEKTKALGLVGYGSTTVLLKDVKHKPRRES
jgi:hypothetical protein